MESKPINDYTDNELTQTLAELEERLAPLQHEQERRQIQQHYYRSSEYLKSQGWNYITSILNRYNEAFWYKVSEYGIRFGYLSNDGFIELPDRLCESLDNGVPTPIATYFLHKFLATYSITIIDKETKP